MKKKIKGNKGLVLDDEAVDELVLELDEVLVERLVLIAVVDEGVDELVLELDDVLVERLVLIAVVVEVVLLVVSMCVC